MAFVHGTSSRVIMDAVAISGYLRGVEDSAEVEMADTTVLTDSGHRFIPGLDNGSLSFDGLFDDTAGSSGLDFTVEGLKQAADASVISVAPAGFALGSRVTSAEARLTNYGIASPVGDAVTFAASWQTDGQVDKGIALHDLTAVTATADGSSVDNAASSATGAVGALHVTANTMNNTVVVKLQDSADDAVWADLITFATIAATTTTAERATATGTVDRYTRATWTCNGTGSITFAAVLARR